jgi:hypothetical protein
LNGCAKRVGAQRAGYITEAPKVIPPYTRRSSPWGTTAVMALDSQVNFIRMELKLATTMLALARTERQMWELEGATKAIANARKALDSAKRFVPKLKNVGAATIGELMEGISKLESAIRDYDGGPVLN